MKDSKRLNSDRRWVRFAIPALALLVLLGSVDEVAARGRGGGGGGGFRGGGGGGRGGGGFQRGGPASGGSVRMDRPAPSYRSYEGGRGSEMGRYGDSRPSRDSLDRAGRTDPRTATTAESGRIVRKTDDGFVARGVVVGEDGAAAARIVHKGDQTYVRGVATDGDRAVWGGARCSNGRCYGGRVVVDRHDYYRHPYYYYPYYYGWYACPYGSAQTWNNRYGTPIYGCSNVVVVHTTISLGDSDRDTSVLQARPSEASVSSAPVLMYEGSSDVSVYGTSYQPVGVYSIEKEGRYYWAPGPADKSDVAEEWSAKAAAMEAPTANSTVITYAVGDRVVYLTNEPPLPGFFSEEADHLHVWIPGVTDPTDEERDLIARVIEAQRSGGKDALDREVRKLEAGHEAPPAAADGAGS